MARSFKAYKSVHTSPALPLNRQEEGKKKKKREKTLGKEQLKPQRNPFNVMSLGGCNWERQKWYNHNWSIWQIIKRPVLNLDLDTGFQDDWQSGVILSFVYPAEVDPSSPIPAGEKGTECPNLQLNPYPFSVAHESQQDIKWAAYDNKAQSLSAGKACWQVHWRILLCTCVVFTFHTVIVVGKDL